MTLVALRPAGLPFRLLSLCSGGGGLDLGVHRAVEGARTLGYVERDAYAAATLVARMAEASLPPAPIWDDLATFDGRSWCGVVDCLLAGYPCQPFSRLGRKLGEQDDRHLWPHIRRVITECTPRWVFLENVANHLALGFEQVRGELHDLGFRVEAGLFAAVEAGSAPHGRARLFVLAHSGSDRLEGGFQAGSAAGAAFGGCRADLPTYPPPLNDLVEWSRVIGLAPGLAPGLASSESGLCGVADGVADRGDVSVPHVCAREDRIRVLGNGVVPEQAAFAFSRLLARYTA